MKIDRMKYWVPGSMGSLVVENSKRDLVNEKGISKVGGELQNK